MCYVGNDYFYYFNNVVWVCDEWIVLVIIMVVDIGFF